MWRGTLIVSGVLFGIGCGPAEDDSASQQPTVTVSASHHAVPAQDDQYIYATYISVLAVDAEGKLGSGVVTLVATGGDFLEEDATSKGKTVGLELVEGRGKVFFGCLTTPQEDACRGTNARITAMWGDAIAETGVSFF